MALSGIRINVNFVRWITGGGAPTSDRPWLYEPSSNIPTRGCAPGPSPVTEFDAALGTLIDDMLETMYAAPGIGLAATQVDVHQRVIVIDVSDEHDQPLVLINPEILAREGEATTEEGCLSVPGIFDEVKRAAKVRVRAQDRDGGRVRARLRATSSRCASSTRWITSKASCSSTICPISSASASARSSTRSARSAPRSAGPRGPRRRAPRVLTLRVAFAGTPEIRVARARGAVRRARASSAYSPSRTARRGRGRQLSPAP